MSRFRLAWIQVRSQIGQLAVAIIVIALGVALAAGMLLANGALRASFEESIDALAGRADLVVSPLSGGTMDETILEKVRAVEGVAASAPLVLGDAFIEGDEPLRVRIVGIDMLDDATVRVYDASPTGAAGVADPLVFLNQPDSVIAPRELLRKRGLGLESVLLVQTPQGKRELTVRGVLEGSGVAGASGGNLLVMDLVPAQEVLGSLGRVTQVDVLAAGGTESLVEARLREALPEHIGVERVSERRAELRRSVAGFQAMLNVIACVGLLLGVLITANRLATVYQERMWEMGVLRGMGWSPRGLLAQLLGEAVLLGTFGALLGLPLGILFARLIVDPVADTMALNFQQTVVVSGVATSPGLLAIAGFAGVVAGVVAAFIPARRAMRASVAALRTGRKRRDPMPEGRWKAWLRVLLPLLAAALLAVGLTTHSAMLGSAAMVLLVASGVLLVPPCLRLIGRGLAPLLGQTAWVGVADQSRAPSRAFGATLMLMIGLALVVWIGNTGASFERFTVADSVRFRRADLLVDSSLNEIVSSSSDLRLPEDLVAKIKQIPGVRAASGEVLEKLSDSKVAVRAIDRDRLLRPDFREWAIDARAERGAFEAVASGEAVFVNQTLALNLKNDPGGTLRIMSPSGPLELPIAGIVRTPFAAPRGDVVMSRDVFKRFWGRSAVSRVLVLAEDSYPVSVIREEILRSLGPAYDLRVSTMEDYAGWIAENVRRGFSFLDAMSALTLAVVLIGTADALAANLRERRREIGTLRAIGVGPSAVAGMVLAQALAIGVVGSALAIVVGLAASYSFVHGVLQEILGWELQVYPSYGSALAAAGMGTAACVIGGVLPAVYAAKTPVIEVLRYE